MKIYRVRPDANSFQGFVPIDDDAFEGDVLKFDGSSKTSTWMPPSVYILYPKLKRGNFFGLTVGTLVLDAVAMDELGDLLEMSGELLELPYKKETYYAINVTECIDVLDEERTTWNWSDDGERLGMKKYAFHGNRLTETPLFKIPQSCSAEILTCEGLKDPEDEFKCRVERARLKGLKFVELWNDAG